MNITEIEENWAEDSKLIHTDLANETRKTVELHIKYSRYYRDAVRKLAETKAVKAKQLKLKTEYYLGELDKATLDKYGWKPFLKKVLKSELSLYLNSDDDLIKLDLRLADADYAATFLEGILVMIKNRGYHIKNVLDWYIFKNGGR